MSTTHLNPYTLICERALVIPDVHQDLNWVKNILSHESGNYDHLVFMGDFFDTHKDGGDIASGEQTAIFLRDILRGVYGSFTYLVGNHDVGYIESCRSLYQGKQPSTIFNYCSGYSRTKAETISKIITRADWKNVDLFKVVNGWLLSHAGLNVGYMKVGKTIDENLADLHAQSTALNDCLYHDVHPLLQIGCSRGGEHSYGGVTWQDWSEYCEIPLLPQIVGHTPVRDTVRQISQSFCIDGSQTLYAFINGDGSTEWKNFRFKVPEDSKMGSVVASPRKVIVRDDARFNEAQDQIKNNPSSQ